jgi:hypothetical protein
MDNRRHVSTAARALAVLACVLFAPLAAAEDKPLAASSDPDQLGKQWWQLILSIPGPQNPFLDETGANCGIGQRGSVWYLYSSSLGPLVELECTIPAGKPIFLALVTVICVPSPGETIKQNIEICREITDQTNLLTLRIDGESHSELIERRASTSAFALPVPDDNVFGFPTGVFAAVHDGYYAKLPPLEPGRHTVRVRGGASDGYLTDTRYVLRIVRPDKELPL